MPVVVIDKEKTVTHLRSRVVEGRLSKVANERFVAALAKANPGVDFSRLKPGMVVTIPRLDDVKLRPKIAILDTKRSRTDEVVVEVERAIKNVEKIAVDQGKRDQAKRVATARTLRLKALESAAKKSPDLRANIKAATETLAAQDVAAKDAAARLKKAIPTWADDLAKLRELGLNDQ